MDRPSPKVPGGAEVTFKHGDPTKVDLTVRHFVDSWVETDFTFRFREDGDAYLHSVSGSGDAYYFGQNESAREKAYETVAEIPCVGEVERLND